MRKATAGKTGAAYTAALREAAVQASRDPLILLVKQFDPAARKIRKMYDDEVDGMRKTSGERIAKARFAIEGRSRYPDATFTLRLSYGAVKGYTSTEHGTKVAPVTYFAGADVGFSRQFDGYSHQRCWINEPSLQNDAAARRVYGLLTRYQVITAIHSPPQGGSGRDRLLCRGLLQTTRAMPGNLPSATLMSRSQSG